MCLHGLSQECRDLISASLSHDWGDAHKQVCPMAVKAHRSTVSAFSHCVHIISSLAQAADQRVTFVTQ